jgi:hypothetical protein
MDGLSILLGVLILIFFIVVFGMNFLNIKSITKKEGFANTKGKSHTAAEAKVRATLDTMAFYNNPDASGNTDGQELCSLFTLVRDTLAKNEAAGKKLDDSEIAKRVEASLDAKIPGGALPCPLLKYPSSDSTDIEWLSFVQSIPEDFGARVVLMARFADTEMTSVASQMQTLLGGKMTVPILPPITPETKEPFINVCPPRIAGKKRDDQEQASCTLPENLSPDEILLAIDSVLENLVAKKNSILLANLIDPTTTIHGNIVNATKSAAYLKETQQKIKDGTLTMTGPVVGLS